MALNLDAVGKKIGPISKEYTWKDAVLYALGVGAGFSDLEYCYEKDLKVIPSFSITIADMFDKGEGKGALVIAESTASHSSGIKLFTARSTIFSRLDGGFGGENPPAETFSFP